MAKKAGVQFPEELPISALVREIAIAVDAHPVVIVAGETGSGKTTQLPKICLAMGRGLDARIGVTQPRRIAATSVAARVASELQVELGKEVGYQIRFANRTTPGTYVKFMTDGILLAEIQGDPLLRAYDTLVIDEAHERTLNIDFLLGYLKGILPKRPDLRVIVSSATLELDRFAAFFDGAPVVQVSGRMFPVETIYRPPTADEVDLADTVANTVEEITSIDPRKDILVFLPGEREIRECAGALTEHALPHTAILPLYGRLSQPEQARVFTSLPERRIVLATNVAETSLTIPGIVYVIDAGLARLNRYLARTGVTQLLVEPIAKASAEQRKGRAGRTQSGVCFRLYEEKEFELRPAFTDPEILRVGLAGAILQMKALGLGDIRAFPFLDAPPKRAIDEGLRVLEELGALTEHGELGDAGRKLSRLPLDPRIGRMLLAGDVERSLSEVLVIAAALAIQDPRERPLAVQRQADQAHRRFADEKSDFSSLLRLWRFYRVETRNKTQAQVKRLCRDHFLSYLRMREWADVHTQLSSVAKDLGFKENDKPASDEAVHRAILPGLLSRIGMWHAESKTYIGARQTRFVLHPSSALAKRPPQWVVVAELVETSKLFGRVAASLDPKWLAGIADHLVRKSYGEPYYAERSAEVMAKENLTLYGLPIAKDHRVPLGPVDPVAARAIFIRHALVRGEYAPVPAPAFAAHNQGMFAAVKRLRDRARKGDFTADEEALAIFFEARVPAHVHSGKTLEQWLSQAVTLDPTVLQLSLSDVLVGDAAELTAERYPESLQIGCTSVPLTYRFEPSEDDDGVTVALPLALLPQVSPGMLDWTIPGYHRELIAALCFGLPKSLQRSLELSRELVDEIANALQPFQGELLPSLAHALMERTGVRVSLSAFRMDELPPYLRLGFRVVSGGKVVAEGRDLRELRQRLHGPARDAFAALSPPSGVERRGLTSFPPDGLAERLELEVAPGQRLYGFPALVEQERHVDRLVLDSPESAALATRAALRRLFLIALGTNLEALEKQLPPAIASSSLSDGSEKPRRQLALRALDEAFQLRESPIPRSERAFRDQLALGTGRLPAALKELGRLALEVVGELDATRQGLKAMTGKPGAPRAALEDMRLQLEYLAPPNLLSQLSRARLRALPLYLRGIRVRLERLPNGPQKDQSKSETVLPFWRDWLGQQGALRARGVPEDEVDAFRYAIEDLRLSVFAPEVGPSVPVSPKRLSETWQQLLSQ